jgi:transcription elongation GreA/GreB family factor
MIRNSKGGHGPLSPVDYHLLSEDCTSEIDSLKKNITSIKNLIDAIHYVAENDNPNTRVVAPGYLVRLEDKDLQTEKIVMRHIIFVNTRINDLYLFKESEEIGQVSSSSPIGRAIVGKKAAEISMMVTDKGGSRQITILEISLAETD